MSDKAHRYCGGTGSVRLASGAEGHCFGCDGTGYVTPRNAERERSLADYARTFGTFTAMRRGEVEAPAGVPFYAFRSSVLAGLERLAETEPQRLPRLYASMASGRMQDVATALYTYGK